MSRTARDPEAAERAAAARRRHQQLGHLRRQFDHWAGKLDDGQLTVLHAGLDDAALGELLAGLGVGQLDEALAGLHRIAVAAGIWEETWQARSVAEVCDMIAAWCEKATPRSPGVISREELAGALAVLAVRTGNGNSYFPALADYIFGYVEARRDGGPPAEGLDDVPRGGGSG